MGSGKSPRVHSSLVANSAQLAYLEKSQNVHAISGSPDILLFDCNKVITKWDFDARQFHYIKRDKCFADLEKVAGNVRITEDIFVDTALLAGTPFLPTLPFLSENHKPHGAVKAVLNNGKSGYTVVVNNQDDPRVGSHYVDRFRKAKLAVKNHPVYTDDGKIEPMNLSQLPNDAVQYLGQRLPDEIFHYMSKGLINPRILQWRTTCEIFEVPPMDSGESLEYKNLISQKIIPLRTSAISLLSSSLHNWYRHKDLVQRCWFTDSNGKQQEITIRVERQSEAVSLVESWNVKEATFKDTIAQYQVRQMPNQSLQYADFVGLRTFGGRSAITTKQQFRFEDCGKEGPQERPIFDRRGHLQLIMAIPRAAGVCRYQP